eukprot:Phypoly_transcript_03729.p1 GENE.Phypoly_transcript_03729~~Phypoly_transcript_03729.p1  ORF type:complete len:737 (+),score=86.88 Phypoly_transcript_03729:116-2326(+)
MRRYLVSSCIQLVVLLLSAQLVFSDGSEDSASSDIAPSYPRPRPGSYSSDEPKPPYSSPYDSYDDKSEASSYGSDFQDENSYDSDFPEPGPPTYIPDPELPAKPQPDPIPPTPEPAPEPIPEPTPEPTYAPLPPTDAPKPPPPALGSVSISMKLLLVGTSDSDTYFLSAKLTLDSVGASYDTAFVGTIPELVNANGGKYGGIIVATSTMLDASLSAALDSYQIIYGVRKVALYAIPDAPAMQLLGSASSQQMYFKIEDAPYTKGVQLSFYDSIPFGYAASVLDASVATPVIIGKLVDGTETVVAAEIHNYDGTKNLEFYVPPTLNAGYTLAFGNVWLQWVSGGMFIGLRRIIWSIQVDDLFLSTEVFDPVTLTQSPSGPTYRCTPADIINLEIVLGLVNEFVPGSNLRAEFAFNGAGVNIGGGLSADPLYLELKLRQNSFFFESHTFTHPSLDPYTYEQTLDELTQNIELAHDFFGTTNSTNVYSSSAMVTPSISGLFNGEVLRALAAVGITTVVGDNSRPELVPENRYHGIYTSVAKHGFDGIFIVPRHVSDIYYDVSSPDAEIAQYTHIYGSAKTLHEIVVLQSHNAAQNLLAYRHDPFMFHQANLGSYSMILGGQQKVTSLISMWIANTFSQLVRFSTLPYWTYKHEDLAEIWKDREIRDNCAADVQATVTNGKITSLYLTSANSCRYALTGIDVVPVAGITSTETYGPDVTTWIILNAGSPIQLTLATPISL